MTYTRIREAAEMRQGGDSSGAWMLADALLIELPTRMGPTPESSSDVATRLAQIADALDADGIETPSGNPYTPATLRELRLVAQGWPKAARMREAAFRTHQEAGTADEWKREVLRVLCLAARSRDWEQPPMNHGAIDDAAWDAAIAGVRRKTEAGTRYPVAANDLRAALRRKINTPPPVLDEAHATIADAYDELRDASDKFDRAARILSRTGVPAGELGIALADVIARLRNALDFLESTIQNGGITDASLAALLGKDES